MNDSKAEAAYHGLDPQARPGTRGCTWVRFSDGARCVLPTGYHGFHEDEHGVRFPPPQREFRGRVWRVA